MALRAWPGGPAGLPHLDFRVGPCYARCEGPGRLDLSLTPGASGPGREAPWVLQAAPLVRAQQGLNPGLCACSGS